MVPVQPYVLSKLTTPFTATAPASSTTLLVTSGSTLLAGTTVPTGQTFTIVIDPDTSLEEIVDVTAVTGNNLTVKSNHN